MSQAFIKAAASYYGINPDALHEDCDITTRLDGNLVFVFYVKPSDADLIGIGKRMEQMAAGKVHLGSEASFRPGPRADARMSGAEPDPYREVSHITTDQPEQEADPVGVWLPFEEATIEQMGFASDYDPERGYLVNEQMLTPEQRAKRGVQ